MTTANTFRGKVHGRHIELDQDTGLPDGSSVSVIIQTAAVKTDFLLRAFGAWADDPEGVDRFLEEMRPRPRCLEFGASVMSFVLDTDICSAYLKGDRRVFNRFIQHSGDLHISAVTAGELYSWIFRADASAERLNGLNDLLGDPQ